MAIDHRIGTKVIKNLRREETPATRVDPYPYIGIVKNNLDPTRSGRLQVFVPDLGGDPDDQTGWRTVGYASPFMGYTQANRQDTNINEANTFDAVPHTYGMWMVPPDIGVEVLVVFVAGDPHRGFWIACVNSNLSQHMLPGMAGSTKVDPGASTFEKQLANNKIKIPVTEYNEYKSELNNQGFYKNPKPVHGPQWDILKKQGLHIDNVRGATSSSSQRETPSNVFGISTPGRPSNNPGSPDPAKDPDYLKKAEAGQSEEEYYEVKSRSGGHTFVMDDGDVLGNDQLLRLRTAKGHQIMMHDTAETLYISHSNGNSWIELTKAGTINVYGKNGIALRSEGTVNIHSDTNIILNATNNITLRAGNKINMESNSNNILASRHSIEATKIEFKTNAFNVDSEGSISLAATGKLIVNAPSGISNNTDPKAPVNGVDSVRLNILPDTVLDRGLWRNRPGATATAVTVLPSHEPYFRGAAVEQRDADAARRKMADTYTGTYDAIKNISPGLATPPITEVLRIQPKAQGPIGPLSEEEVRAYMAAMGAAESSSPTDPKAVCGESGLKLQNGKAGYEAINQCGFVGKYQVGYEVLIDAGLVKSNVTSNSALNNANSWVGGDKPANIDAFKADAKTQEQVMFDLTQRNYKSLVSKGAITKDMTNAEIGGMLGAAHLLGAGGANSWRKSSAKIEDRKGKDGNNTTGGQWYSVGSAGVAAASKLPKLDAG